MTSNEQEQGIYPNKEAFRTSSQDVRDAIISNEHPTFKLKFAENIADSRPEIDMMDLLASLKEVHISLPKNDDTGFFKRSADRLISTLAKERGQSPEELTKTIDKTVESQAYPGKYTVWHNTFIGGTVVKQTETLAEVVEYLDSIKDLLQDSVIDDDYLLELPDGRQLLQQHILKWLHHQKSGR